MNTVDVFTPTDMASPAIRKLGAYLAAQIEIEHLRLEHAKTIEEVLHIQGTIRAYRVILETGKPSVTVPRETVMF